MAPISANNFIKNPNEYLDKASKPNGELLIKTKIGEVVLLNADTYRSLVETAYLNSIPELAKDIIDGMNTPLAECTECDWKNEL